MLFLTALIFLEDFPGLGDNLKPFISVQPVQEIVAVQTSLVPSLVQKSVAIAVQKSAAAVPTPVQKSATVSAPEQKSAAVLTPEQKSAAVLTPAQMSDVLPSPVQKSSADTPVQKSDAVNTPVQKSAIVFKPQQKSDAVSTLEQKSAVLTPAQNSVAVPTLANMETYRCTVSYVESPNSFFVSPLENQEVWENIMMDVQNPSTSLDLVEVGNICISEQGGLWSRCKIEQMSSNTGEVRVFFIDHGSRETKPVSSLRKLETRRNTPGMINKEYLKVPVTLFRFFENW